MIGELVYDKCQLIRLSFDSSARTLSAKIDAGSVISDTITDPHDTGDSSGTLTLGYDAGGTGTLECKIGELFISKTIADEDTTAEQERWYAAAFGIDALKPEA